MKTPARRRASVSWPALVTTLAAIATLVPAFGMGGSRTRTWPAAHVEAEPERWCGTGPHRRDEEKLRHEMNLTRLRRRCEASAPANPTSGVVCGTGHGSSGVQGLSTAARGFDAGEIAVVEDDGTIVIPARPFSFPRNYSVLFTPAGTDGFSITTGSARLEKGGQKLRGFIGGGAGAGAPTDDGYKEVIFEGGFTFPFFGRTYDRLFVGTNGFLTFDSGDVNSPANVSAAIFAADQPRIAPFWTDLDTRRGGIFVRQDAGGVIVTWKKVPPFGGRGANTFQVELFADGRIAFRYRKLSSEAELIGLSPGGNLAPLRQVDFRMPDTSSAAGAPIERFSPITEVDRIGLAQAFYGTHGDDYDFLYTWTDFPTDVGDAFAFYDPIRNDVRGIGQTLYDDSAQFGSAGRLQGLLHLNRPDLYPDDPAQIFYGLSSALSIFAQEQGHRWLAYVRFADNGRPNQGLLGRDLAHWSFFFNTESAISAPGARHSSSMEGNVIEPLSPRRFRTVEDSIDYYSALDQYLMGLRFPAEVPASFLVRGSGTTPGTEPRSGARLGGPSRTIPIEDIISIEGPRDPAFPASQRAFRAAWIVLVQQGTTPSGATLAKLERFRAAWEHYFNVALEGRGTLSTSLVAPLQ